MIKVKFICPNSKEITVEAKKGDNLLAVAEKNDIPLKGACAGNLACGTCHVIIDKDWSDIVDDECPLIEREEDVLELAPGLEPTSRLSCQIKLTEKLDGLVVYIPKRNRNND